MKAISKEYKEDKKIIEHYLETALEYAHSTKFQYRTLKYISFAYNVINYLMSSVELEEKRDRMRYNNLITKLGNKADGVKVRIERITGEEL